MTQSTFGALKETSTRLALELEAELNDDVMAIIGPIVPGADQKVRDAIEKTPDRRKTLAVVLSTPGGVVEVVERMVEILRHHYDEVKFIVPDSAMSAGTVFAMSGDAILMTYFSCLGPIDPQVQRNGTLVPALSYLVQYDRLVKKSAEGTLTTAELAMMSKFDLAELHKFEEAKELSRDLLTKWLAQYKFKDWTVRRTSGTSVNQADRETRASEIADALSNHQKWHSHARGISMRVLVDDINLRIDDYEQDAALSLKITHYYSFLTDLMHREDVPHLVHTPHHL